MCEYACIQHVLYFIYVTLGGSEAGLSLSLLLSLSLSGLLQSGLHKKHEAGSREPQEPSRAVCGVRGGCKGQTIVASPGR